MTRERPRGVRAGGRYSPAVTPRCSAVLAVALACTLAPHAGAEEMLVDGIAAQVGNDVVLISEVMELAAPVEERMRSANAPREQIAALHSQVLERLIEATLVSELVERLELSATAVEVDDAIRGIAADTGLTMNQLMDSVASHGLSFPEYRAKIASEIERAKVLNAMVRSQVRLDPEEVEALYRQRFSSQRAGGTEVHLHHLVVAFGQQLMRDRATACAIAEDGRQRIASGELTFEEVARRLSDLGPEAPSDMGWVHVSDLASWMTAVVNRLEPGELSGVIETRFGCNLLMLDDRREFTPVTLEEVRPQLENELFQRKSEEKYIEWLSDLRENAYIERKGVFAGGPGGLP